MESSSSSQSGSPEQSSCRILTVGDGDLTLSLALARAYGRDHVHVTASVLDSQEELLASFPDAPIRELQELQVPVLFQVDATQLHHQYGPDDWDVVLFHHPHLGLASLSEDESLHATCHYQLLCHYLYSASRVARKVHVCLCGNQRQTWKLDGAAERQGLQLWRALSTTVPFCQVWTDKVIPPTEAQSEYAAPRRYRNGKLGSRHFLGKYGYRHRRTAGQRYQGGSLDMNVAGSMHYVFQLGASCERKVFEEEEEANISGEATCSICGAHFPSKQSLHDHYSAPATPQWAEMSNQVSSGVAVSGKSQNSSSCSDTSNQDARIEEESCGHLPIDRPKLALASQDFVGKTKDEIKVTPNDAGKRLRQFLQHNRKLSKRQAEMAVQNGTVWIDGVQAPDSSRVVQTGMVIQIVSDDSKTDSAITASLDSVKLLHHHDPFVVVNKPSGMRTKGAMVGTLEYMVSQQQGSNYECLSKLDTSCSGLCVLIPQASLKHATLPEILHSMLVLVHGRVPDNWFPQFQHSVLLQRKWKNKKRKHDVVGEANDSECGDTTISDSSLITIIPLERTTPISASTISATDSSSCLSTVRIETEYPSAASVCQWMRLLGYPVVGDVNCHKEYLTLKRSIRNRIKNKLCITCYQVQWQDQSTSREVQYPIGNPPIPEKLSAVYWESNFTLSDSTADKDET